MLAAAVISSGAQVLPPISLVFGRVQLFGAVAVELMVVGFFKVSRRTLFTGMVQSLYKRPT